MACHMFSKFQELSDVDIGILETFGNYVFSFRTSKHIVRGGVRGSQKFVPRFGFSFCINGNLDDNSTEQSTFASGPLIHCGRNEKPDLRSLIPASFRGEKC